MSVERRAVQPSFLPRGVAAADWRGALAWLVVVAVALVWGTAWVADSGVGLRAAPLYGRWSWHPGVGLLPAVAMGAATVVWGPTVAARLRWRWVPVATGAWAVAWAVALAASDGWSRLTAPLTTEHEYEPLAARVDGLGGFLSGYVGHLGEYPTHVQGHPPGPVVIAWFLDHLGLGGGGWLAAVVLLAWGVAAAAALVAAGEATARRVASAVAALPAAVWAGTSMDALFAGLLAVAIAGLVVATRRDSVGWASAGGVVGGVALLCTYGATVVLLVGVAAVLLLAARPGRLLVTAAAGASVTLALAALAGFWWPAGLAATGEAYWDGAASARPAVYLTLVGNPAALALATGPAVAAGFWARRVGLLPVLALGAVAIADLSQMSRGEVERIWLPFVPWLALAAPGDSRAWLAAQVGVALLLQSILASAW